MEFDAIQMLGAPGWIELRLRGDEAPRVLAKFEEREGRGVLTTLILTGGRLDSSMLRSVPMGRIESAVNHPKYGFAGGSAPPLDPDVERSLADRGHLFPAEFRAIDKALRSFLEKQPAAVPGVQVAYKGTPREPLSRPDGTDPDSFYRQVAAAYNSAVMEGPAPAKVLAEEAGVPVTTVHRWIREARTRGHLPPARKGRAG